MFRSLVVAVIVLCASRASAQDPPRARVEARGAELAADTTIGITRHDDHDGTLRRGAAASWSVTLAAGECAALVARAEPSVTNLDAAFRAARGAMLARDTETGPAAEVRTCAPGDHALTVRAEVRAFVGEGAYAATLFVYTPRAATAAPLESTATTALDRLRAALATRPLLAPVTPAERENLAVRGTLDRFAELQTGRCYALVARAEEGLSDLDVALLGPRGTELARDSTHDAAPELARVCPVESGRHTLRFRATRGAGAFAWQVLSVREEAVADAGPIAAAFRVGGTGSDFVAGRLRARHAQVGEARAAVTDVTAGTLRTSESRDVEVELERSRCYVVLAVGAPSARGIGLELVDGLGTRQAQAAPTDAQPTLRHCPTVSGRYRLTVRMHAGYGPFGVQVFGGPP